MTTEEKLKYFEESSLEEARKQASAMIEEYKVNLDKVEKEHKATTLRQSDLQLKTESDNLKRNNNMALSKDFMFLTAVRTFKVRHIFNNSKYRNIHHICHINRLFHYH